jgi:hypothetical protein
MAMSQQTFKNPFRPGAGHKPPYLAGRQGETDEFQRLLKQEVILENLVLTGLRGVGKTVLMDAFKPIAIDAGWLWVGTDLSESVSLSEDRIAVRLLSDLSVITSSFSFGEPRRRPLGFAAGPAPGWLDFPALSDAFNRATGLVADRLKAALQFAWDGLKSHHVKGVVFAYDEAQNLSDHAQKDQYPLSLMLDCFQSIQRKEIPFMLALAGLPTLFPKLVEARTFSERMFRVLFLDRLGPQDTKDAILKPIEGSRCPVRLTRPVIDSIVKASGGYPYLIQYLCRETYDSYLQQWEAGVQRPRTSIGDIVRKLDTDFYAGRWARATDRQRELLYAAAKLNGPEGEFGIEQLSRACKKFLRKPISASQLGQMLAKLAGQGLVYKTRRGKYAFAVPLMGEFVLRHEAEIIEP